MLRKTIIGLILILVSFLDCFSQSDTLKISIDKAEDQFIRNNLQLLAARYNIDVSKAAIIQAKLFPNPNIQIEQNIYNQFTKRLFDVTKDGNTEIQIQQLIQMAGKRNKLIKLAELNSLMTEFQLYDLLRTLKYTLRSNFFDIYYLQQSLAFYNEAIPAVERTVASVEAVFSQRSILQSEVMRLKALLFQLQTERIGIENQIGDLQLQLKVLIRDTSSITTYYIPDFDKNSLNSMNVQSLDVRNMIQWAKENRSDYKIANAAIKIDEANLAIQKSLGVPDITVGGRYSRNGSYIPDYFGVTIGVDIPLFNRNQGNIAVSEKMIEMDKTNLLSTQQNIEKDILSAYNKALSKDKYYKSYDKGFIEDYKNLVINMTKNYENRNIKIIEFTDFYESYRQTLLQLNQLQNDRVDAIENLNFVVGKTVLNP